MTSSKLSIDKIWKILLTIILLFYGLFYGSSVIIPLLFSFFLAIIFDPLVIFFEKRGIIRGISIAITLLLVFLVFSGAIYYVSFQAKSLILDLPDLVNKFKSFIDKINKQLESLGGFSYQEQVEFIKQNTDKLLSSGSALFSNALTTTSNILTFITLVPIYIFFMLLYKGNFKKFIVNLDKKKQDNNLLEMALESKAMVHSYIAGLLIVITIVAVLNTVGLLILGLKYAVFMGILSAVLTVIPYIGIFIGGLLPVLVALLTKDSLLYPLGVVIVVGTVQFLEGNFITPNVVGSKVNVNPLAAIIALIIGAKLWGIVGMILAIPLTGITKIIFSHYDRLKPYAVLLQTEDDGKSSSFLKELKIWQKLKSIFKKD
jgi:predicted PurR-regulated permease PerM